MDAQLLALALRRLKKGNSDINVPDIDLGEGMPLPENPYTHESPEQEAYAAGRQSVFNEAELSARNGAPLQATENDPGYAAKMARGDFGVANSVPDRLVASVPIAPAGDVSYNVQRGPSTFKQDNKDMVAILQARHAAGASPPAGVPVTTQLAPPPPGTPVVTQLVERPSAGNAYGAIIPGNIDLTHRPYVQNADGSVSTVRSMGVNIDGKEVLIPTVSPDGRIMSDDEAVAHYMKTGQHLGIYSTPEASTAAGEAIHQDQMAHPPIRTNPPAAIAAPSSLPPISNTQQLYAARQALLGQQLQNVDQRTAIQQAGHQQAAQVRAAAGEYGMARFAKLTQRVEEQRAARDYFRGQAEQHIMQLQKDLGDPPSTTKADVMGLIAGVLSAGNQRGQMAGALMGGLSQIMMRPYQRWQAGLDMHSKLSKEFEALAQGRARGAEADLDEEKRMSDLLYANVDNALKQITENSASLQVQSLGEDARAELRGKWLDLKEKQLNDHTQLIDQYNMMDPNELASLIQQGRVGKIGQDVYNEREQQRLARLQQSMALAKTQQEISNAADAPERKEQELSIPGLRALPGATAADKAKAQGISAGEPELLKASADMKKYIEENGWVAADKYNQAALSFIGALNQVHGGTMNKGEYENYKSMMPTHPFETNWATKAIYNRKYGPEIIDSIVARGKEIAAERLRTYKYERAPAAAATIRVKLPSGRIESYPDDEKTRSLIQDHQLTVVP